MRLTRKRRRELRRRYEEALWACTGFLTWSDRRFDLVTGRARAGCGASSRSRWIPELGFNARVRCRRVPAAKVGGIWYCWRCLREQPLPLWEESPELHMRPHWPGGLSSLHCKRYDALGAEEAWLSQADTQVALDCDADTLWEYVSQGRLPSVQGAEYVPYRFRAETVETFRQALAEDAARRLGAVCGAGGVA